MNCQLKQVLKYPYISYGKHTNERKYISKEGGVYEAVEVYGTDRNNKLIINGGDAYEKTSIFILITASTITLFHRQFTSVLENMSNTSY